VFPCSERREGHGVMARGRGCDHHRVDVVTRDQRVEIVGAPEIGMLGPRRREPLRVEIAQGRDPRAGEPAEGP
jgi:hypothetical protein